MFQHILMVHGSECVTKMNHVGLSTYRISLVAQATILITMIFTVVVWAGSAVLLLIAAIMYIPLLCHIQGNLKEYCCHKIDKRFVAPEVSIQLELMARSMMNRIAEMMKKKTRKRLLQEAAKARKEAAGDYSHLKDKKGNLKQKPMAQPTLPKVDLYDEETRYKRDNSYSDLSMRKDPLYFQSTTSLPGHAYPPTSTGWGRPDGPQPQPSYGYEGSSEVGGYAGSVHSMDRLVQTPAENDPYSGNYLGKAPSYRSQTSLNDVKSRPWESSTEAAPPVPTYSSPLDSHPQYFTDYSNHSTPQQVQPRSRSPGPNDFGQSNGGRRSPGPNAAYDAQGQYASQGYAEEEYQVRRDDYFASRAQLSRDA